MADAKDALPRLLAKLDGYKAPYTTEVTAAREKWAKELERLDHITFEDKKSWKPIINDANADSAKRFAKDLGAGLCQTTVLGAIKRHDERGRRGHRRRGFSARRHAADVAAHRVSTATTWSTATPPWAMRWPAPWA